MSAAESPLVGIIMGSDSDWPTLAPAAEICEQFGVRVDVQVVSAHRTPDVMAQYARSAERRGLRVIIAGAGGAAGAAGAAAGAEPAAGGGKPADDNVVDAEVKEVKKG